MSERRRAAPGGRKTARRPRAKTAARPSAPTKKRAKSTRRKTAKPKASASKSAAPKAGGAKTKRAAKAADPHAAVRRYRERMRARGLRPVTIWVPDLKDPETVRQLQDGIAAVAEHERTSPQAREDAAFWDKVAEQAWADLPDYDWGPNGPPKG